MEETESMEVAYNEPTSNIEETIEKIADLLNDALISNKDLVKITNLKHAQELLIFKSSNLLDNFLEEILQFQADKSVEVKKVVITFIEEACKRDYEVIFKVIDNLRYLLFDDNVNVQKRAYLAMINIFKNTLKCIAKRKEKLDEHQEQTWLSLIAIKDHIISQIDSDNDGIRTTAIKFVEMIILVFSPRTKESFETSSSKNEISLDQVSSEHPLMDRESLLEESRAHLKKLIDYTLSIHISSVNLISSICVLSNIARQRPQFMGLILDTYSKILKNMPPTLGQSQVNTVRKQMKMQVLLLCKNSCAAEFHSDISAILTDLGASSSEISRAVPKPSSTDLKKRNLANFDLGESAPKKSKVVEEGAQQRANINLDTFIDEMVSKLSVQDVVVDLVIKSMQRLPEQMPASFPNAYKPISGAGTSSQIKTLAKMLVTQLHEAGLLKLPESEVTIDDLDNEDEENDEETSYNNNTGLALIKSEKGDSGASPKLQRLKSSTPSTPIVPTKPVDSVLSKQRVFAKTFKLNEVTANTQLNPKTLETLLNKTYNRILSSEEELSKNKEASAVRKKVIVEFASLPNYEQNFKSYVFEDIRKRSDLAVLWIYNKYLKYKEAQCNQFDEEMKDECEESEGLVNVNQCELDYNRTVQTILLYLQESNEILYAKFLNQIPLLTDTCLNLVSKFCQDEKRFQFNVNTVCELIKTRSADRSKLFVLLFAFCQSANVALQDYAIQSLLKLYESERFQGEIESFALRCLDYLTLANPPKAILTEADEHVEEAQWTEDTIKTCLVLYLNLTPIKHSLIQKLSQVYSASISEVKRVILKLLEVPIRKMGMQSADLLKLIQDFPHGSETLVLRIIHILTEHAFPSVELVNKVRELYEKKSQDVRFLIPVLVGLSKTEIINALPQLIKLSQPVVKEVFNRLLGINAPSTTHKSPITPAELLIALHQIDQTKCDLKTVITATSLCFAEKQIYTQEVLATVMQRLIDVSPIPTLYMRTVIQSVTMFPKLTGFVIIMMQRLVGKCIWKHPKVWEGFIKCCQRIRPLSHQILLQLPALQLQEVFNTAPELKEHVSKHLATLSQQQRSQIPDQVIQVIEQPASSLSS